MLSTERLVSKPGIPNALLGCFLPTHQRFLLPFFVFVFSFVFCFVLIVHSLPETFIHTMFFFLNVLCFFSWDGRGHDLLFTHDTWLQLRTEPAQNAAGPGQRTNRNCFSYEQGGALRGGLGDWRVMEVRRRLEDVISSHVESRSRARVPASVGVQASFPGALPTSFHIFSLYITSLLQLTAWYRSFYGERGQDYSWSSMIISKEKK